MSNLDVRDEVNEEIGKIVANDHTSNVSKYPVDEIRVGLEFTCIEDAKKFYNDYAFKMGFSIRKQTHYKARKQDDAITSITYCCSKAGNSKPTSQEKSEQQNSQGTHTPQKDFPNRRTNCKAHIVLKIDDRGKWVITVFANEHNHELIASPSKTRFFRSHRNITKEQKDLIHMLNEQNISASQIMSFLEVKEGGRHNTQFIRKDLSNELFEFYGLLCAHALKVMHHIEVYSIPPRFDSLALEAQKFIFEGSKSLKAYENACRIIREGVDVLTSINQIIKIEEGRNEETSNDLRRTLISQSSLNQCTIKDPPHSQCKGRRRPQRIKPPVEKKARMSRTCKQCGKKEHNIRTCKETFEFLKSENQTNKI
ncbi:Protein FAR1-RELATED SEQUENCE 5 [Ananas comosus]|uniref:Protein FAR1-RELATED SEQUENCE 5 n=1 Tax=Ananas comosus TaxID=4615 RepID=A0A199VVY7_ANACO|nr:Protein FAR1-RELATED SEQUENCE 5 [Ananas comosus]